MLSHAIRASRRVSSRRSTLLYQHLTESRLVTTVAEDKQIQRPPLRTAYLRTWEPIKNVGDVFSLLRTLERKYGKILEARFAKDYEDPTKYQMIAWIIFEDPKSLQRIPLGGVDFATPASGLLKEHHDIGLEDLEPSSRTVEFEEGYEFPVITPESRVKVIGGRITRSEADYTQNHKERMFQLTPKAVMTSFLQWGGFHKMAPLDPPREIVEAELFGQTPLDNVRMRAAMQIASQATKLPNPTLARKGSPKAASSTKRSTIASLLFGETEPSSSSQTTSTSSTSIPDKSATAKPPTPPTPAEVAPSPSPPKEKDAATIAQELANQEALKRQLNFAKQLNERSVPMRRRQPKPQIKVAQPKTPEFFADQFLPRNEPAPKQESGVMDKLWGIFGKK